MKKKLAKYLADYIEHEYELDAEAKEYDVLDYETIIVEGIEAFESTEDVNISFSDGLIEAAREIVSDFKYYGEVLQVGDNGEYGTESAIGRLTFAVEKL